MALTSPKNRPEGSGGVLSMSRACDAFFPRESAPASSPIAAKLGPRYSPYRRAWLLGATILAPILALRLGCDVLEWYYTRVGRRIALAVLRPPPVPRNPPPAIENPYEAGYARGRSEAVEELAKGSASLYVAGLLIPVRFDRHMGLSLNYVAGCVIDERTEGRILGHNDAIREQLDAAGLAASLYSPWEGMLARARAAILMPRWERPSMLRRMDLGADHQT